MARRRVAFIQNDSARKATYKKRSNSLVKKLDELTTLCGVDACCVIYGPGSDKPLVWPQSQEQVQRVLTDYLSLPQAVKTRSSSTAESLLLLQIVKERAKLEKQCKENRKKEVTEVMFQCLNGKDLSSLNLYDLNDLAWLVDDYLKNIRFHLGERDPEPGAVRAVGRSDVAEREEGDHDGAATDDDAKA